MKKTIFANIAFLLSPVTLLFCRDDNSSRARKTTNDTITIGNQVWMKMNLDVAHYRNGDPILHAKIEKEWVKAGEKGIGAWCYNDNDPKNGKIYDKLYNWYAVNDPRGLAPEGWHVPSDDEWKELESSLRMDELGMDQEELDDLGYRGINEGSKLAVNYDLWESGDLRENSEFGSSGFGAIAGGYRDNNGFYGIGRYGYWWSSSEYGSSFAIYRCLNYCSSGVYRYYYGKGLGFSVRCVRD